MFRKILILAAFIALSSYTALSFAELSLPQEDPVERATATTEAKEPQQVSSQNVTSIEIVGNKSISSNTIISKMKTKVGAPYMENVVNDDLKRLYLLGYFSDININTEPYKDGIKIIITVDEKPVIDKITFEGMKKLYYIKPEKLKESLKSKETQYLDYPTLKEDARIIKAMYEKKGFSEARVDYKVDIDKETGKANISFIVDEGTRLKIKKIYVEGNKTFKSRRVLKLLKTKSAWLFNAGVFKDEVFEEDLERIKSFYRREGFSDVQVDYDIKRDERPKKPFIYITIKIEEGKRYYVGEVKIQGNTVATEKEIRDRLKVCLQGKVFSSDGVKEDVSNISGLYFDRGYIFAQVGEVTALNPETGNIDITYTIVENEVAYVDKIKVRGNVKTKDIVIRRELRINPGDKFDGDKLRRSKERLVNLGFFEDVGYDTEASASGEENKRDLIVDVKEAKTGTFSFGGGYSTVDQMIGFIEIEQKNFDWKNWPYFTGDGQDLKLRASIGGISNAFELSFTEPWMFDYPVAFGFDAYRRVHERDEDSGYSYDEEVTGGDLRLGKTLSEYVKADMMYRFDNIRISNIDANASNELKKEEGRNSISSIQFGLGYDSRDNVFDTHRGDIFGGSIELAGIGGTKDYFKFQGRASHFIPLFRKSALEFRLRTGLATPYSDTKELPIYERFFVGGTYTVRGYNERKIGPVDSSAQGDPLGGQAMLVGNVEYTYPVFDFLKAVAFFDTGNAWKKVGLMGFRNFKSGIGFGVRVKTPIGPIRLDYGIPLNKESGKEKRSSGRLHFGVSGGF